MNSELLSKGFLYVPNFIDAEHADYLYHSTLKDSVEWDADNQCPYTPAKYKYSVAETELKDRLDSISKLVEEPILPTYSYARVYGKHDELPPHLDRPACELSVSVVLNKDHDWPIHIDDGNGKIHEVELEIGDAVIFLGVFHNHWREKFQGDNYTAFFLHYVRENSYGARLVNDEHFCPDRVCHDGRVRTRILRNELIDLGWDPVPFDEYSKPNHRVKDFVHVYHDAIDPDLCDHIIEHFHEDHHEWKPALTAGDQMDGNDSSKERVNDIAEISRLRDEKSKEIDMQIYDAVSKISVDYAKMHEFVDVQTDEGYFLLRYKTGGQYVCHADSGTRQHREVSMVALLSDPEDFEGGDLTFMFGMTPKLKKGSIVAFPSNFVYAHRVTPVTRGTRYSLVTWFK